MTPVFADTSFYVALHNRRDAHHRSAVALATDPRLPPIVTTEYVLLEVANFFKTPRDRTMFVRFHTTLVADPRTTLVPSSHDLYAKGLALFAARADKEWSLTDCTSFEVMRELGLTDGLTADQHFAQAGFVPLLAAAP